MNPFTPAAATVNATPGATAAIALPAGTNPRQVMITLAGTNPAIAFIKFGSSSVTASATADTPVLPNTQVIFSVPAGATHVAVVGTAGTIYITAGNGI